MTIAVLLLWSIAAQTPRDLVPPRSTTIDELAREVFDPAWILPEDLPVARMHGSGPQVNLVSHMRSLLALRGDATRDAPRSFGDAVDAVRRAGGAESARERVLAELARAQPQLARALESALRELLAAEALLGERWNPDRDDPRDGIYFAHPLTLEFVRERPWSQLTGSRLVQQACVLVFADLATIKQAENDYRAYPRRPGANYESIYPIPGSHVRGVDARGHAFAALRIHFRCDLPFPFSDYSCDLSIWNRVAEDGAVCCDIYSPSRDFLWLAGRDTYLPVSTESGAQIATLIVRWFGFDLRGVPDGDDARRAGLRASLGSLKREAEALFGTRSMPPPALAPRVPEFDVRGER